MLRFALPALLTLSFASPGLAQSQDWEDLAKDAKKKLGTLFESEED